MTAWLATPATVASHFLYQRAITWAQGPTKPFRSPHQNDTVEIPNPSTGPYRPPGVAGFSFFCFAAEKSAAAFANEFAENLASQ